MKLNPVYIHAFNIPDAWFQLIYNLFDRGGKYIVEKGSFEGETRLEYDWASVYIEFPYDEPYDRMLPAIPSHLNIPNPVENGYVEQYLPYLFTDHIEPHESYTYGSRIAPQINCTVEILKKTPKTNQALLQIASPEDAELSDPPCLRHVDLRIKYGELIFYPYFRSWDLWGGFPANLAGLAVLQKYMADEIGVKNGPMLASSKGLHIYGYAEEIAKLRANKC